MSPLQAYIARLAQEYKTGVTTEHSLRPALVELLTNLEPLKRFAIINEPKRIECGAPDIVLLNKENTPVAYLETKDIGDADLRGTKQNKEQFDRYKQGLECVVFTDFLRFLLYQDGECVCEVRVAEQDGDRLTLIPDAEVRFEELVAHLRDAQPSPITSPKRLALLMAGKAQLLASSVAVLLDDKDSKEGQKLLKQLGRMKAVLMSDVSSAEFADWYAQTLVYGLFAARYHDEHLETFSREEAARLIPQSNPFLRELFQHIGVYNLDERIAWIIDDLVGVFGATDVRTLLDTNRAERDPIMLFYEDFLTAYNPERRKARGVYYTPAPVVSFIVRAVDDLLQKAFGLKDGLADCSLTTDGKHRLQILDPATGTGTFLAGVVRKIYSKFAGQTGVWNDYVRDHLLPRLHGYEILMAPYAMAHLNLEYVFRETGATSLGDARYGIYLTNTLEEEHPATGGLFPIDDEAEAANALKREMRVMVMLGNPPYSRGSKNKSAWIEGLMECYKPYIDADGNAVRGSGGGVYRLAEQNINSLSDDYLKFIRFAQYQVERTGEGIVGFITSNSFLAGVIHRAMRAELLRVFDEIYILNLHGNSRLKEKTPEGGKDENVFNIQTGVSITLLVKHKEEQNRQAMLHYAELYGLRKEKFAALETLRLSEATWRELHPVAPYYFFVPKDFVQKNDYERGFSIEELFIEHVAGMTTTRDMLLAKFSCSECESLKEDLLTLKEDELRRRYGKELGKDTRDWKLQQAVEDLESAEKTHSGVILPYTYRPYDTRYTLYTGKTGGIAAWPRFRLLGSLLCAKNYALCTTRMVTSFDQYRHCFITNKLIDICTVSNRPSEVTTACPLYRIPAGWDYTPAELAAGQARTGEPIPLELNMRTEVLEKISEAVGEPVTGEDVFDYVYGVLHDPEYRLKYFEFLKIDYPRIPYPANLAEYRLFAARGARLRRLHLMEETLDLPAVATFDIAGSNEITVVRYEEGADAISGRVWINDTQYFAHVPRAVWDHYVGAYQPARLWLQKRIGRRLDYDDVRWYLRICATIAAEYTQE